MVHLTFSLPSKARIFCPDLRYAVKDVLGCWKSKFSGDCHHVCWIESVNLLLEKTGICDDSFSCGLFLKLMSVDLNNNPSAALGNQGDAV